MRTTDSPTPTEPRPSEDEKCRCARYAGSHMKEAMCPQNAMGRGWPGFRPRKQ